MKNKQQSEIFNRNNVKDFFKENYSGIGTIKNFKTIQSNKINSINYLINTTRRKYVLHNYLEKLSSQKIEKICQIINFCAKNKVKVSKPIIQNDGNYTDFKNRVFLTEYYKRMPYKGTEREIIDAAKNLANLHKALKKSSIVYNFKTNEKYYKILTEKEFQKINSIILKKKKKYSLDKLILQNISFIQKILKHSSNNLNSISKLKFKKQLMHYDFHPGNVIFNNKKLVSIIDFNSMKMGLILEDVAFGSFRFALLNSRSIKDISRKIELFTETYNENNEINENYHQYLQSFLRRELLRRLSFILRKRYFYNSDLWSTDFEKNLKFLKLANKLSTT